MLRYDSQKLDKFEKTPSGGLKITGNLTRCGIFEYKSPDGSIRKEYRPAEEVFKSDHLRSFSGAPVTIGHPGKVTPDNWKQVAIGHVGEDVRQDGNYAVGSLYIQDAKAIAEVGHSIQEISCGYDIDLDPTPGEFEGQRYDAIQRNIRGNHVALGPAGWGRAGRDVALRLDSAGNEVSDYTNIDMANESTPKPADAGATEIETKEVTIRVDGQAEIDRLSAENSVLRAKVEELSDTSRLDALVQERVALETVARDCKVEPKNKSNRDLKVEIIKSKTPKFKLDSKLSDDAVNAAYELALAFETPSVPHESLGKVRQDAHVATEKKDSLADAERRNRDDSLNAWKKPLRVTNGAR